MTTTSDARVVVTVASGIFETPNASVIQLDSDGGERHTTPLPGVATSHTVVIDCDDPHRWYLPTRNEGVLISEDSGHTWDESNTGIVYRECWSLAQTPTGKLYVGTGPVAMYTSDDRGATWSLSPSLMALPQRRTWEFPAPPYIAHVKNITVADDAPDTLIAAVEEGHLIRTTNGGGSWESLSNGVEYDSHAVCLLPGDPMIVVATSGTGIYRSANGGDTFTNVTGEITRRYMAPPVNHPDQPDIIFAGGAATAPPYWGRPRGACGALYRSNDAGETWNRLEGGYPTDYAGAPTRLAIDPADPDRVYFAMSNGSVWRTDDGGEHITEIASRLGGIIGIAVADDTNGLPRASRGRGT